MGMIAGVLLLVMEEYETFWTLRAFITRLFPHDYYDGALLGVMIDQRVLSDLISTNEPKVYKLLEEHRIEISLITVNWFLTAYCNVAPLHTVMRIWDCLMAEGSSVLFKIALAMITLSASELCAVEDAGQMFNALADAPTLIDEPELLMKLAFSFMHIEPEIPRYRANHRAELQIELYEIQQRRLVMRAEREGKEGRASELKRGSSAAVPSPHTARKLFGAVVPRVHSDKDVAAARMKSKNIVRSEILGNCFEAVVVLTQQFAVLEREEREEVEERERLAAEVHAFLESKAAQKKAQTPMNPHDQAFPDTADGTSPAPSPRKTDHFGTSHHQIIEIVGDEKKYPTLVRIIDELLGPALDTLMGYGLAKRRAHPNSTAWDFVAHVCETSQYDLDKDKTIREEERMGLAETQDAICAAVATIGMVIPSTVAAVKVAKLHAFVRYGLNKRQLSAWFSFLGTAAASSQACAWYTKQAFMRSKPVTLQITHELQKLGMLSFKLAIEPAHYDI